MLFLIFKSELWSNHGSSANKSFIRIVCYDDGVHTTPYWCSKPVEKQL